MPHQIVHYEGTAPCYVCTIPFSLFSEWKLPSTFVSRILKGEVMFDASDIGEAVGLHPDYANTIFKKAFGSTLSEYVIEERISHAQRKLISTDENITSIVFECGFNSISWFNACFKQMNGCTPREFRKNYRGTI